MLSKQHSSYRLVLLQELLPLCLNLIHRIQYETLVLHLIPPLTFNDNSLLFQPTWIHNMHALAIPPNFRLSKQHSCHRLDLPLELLNPCWNCIYRIQYETLIPHLIPPFTSNDNTLIFQPTGIYVSITCLHLAVLAHITLTHKDPTQPLENWRLVYLSCFTPLQHFHKWIKFKYFCRHCFKIGHGNCLKKMVQCVFKFGCTSL